MEHIVLPDAEYAPYAGKTLRLLRQDICCAHTEVGSNEGSISIGAQAGHSYAHNYTDCLGVTHQRQSLAYQAAANLYGNPYVISWETEDMDSRCFASWGTSCGNVPAWTEAQVNRLILDMAWCCIRFAIPPYLIPDTKAGRRGLAYHRQGVPGSPEWVTGALAWSSSIGKCCPDWRRIEQFITRIVPGVRALVFGPTAPTVPQEDEDMPWIIAETNGRAWLVLENDAHLLTPSDLDRYTKPAYTTRPLASYAMANDAHVHEVVERAIERGRSISTADDIARGSELRLAAIQQIEQREEDRDLAPLAGPDPGTAER